MEMSRKRFYQISAIVVFVTVSSLIGFLVWRHWANQNVLIGQEQAIQNAIPACEPHGLQPVEQPTKTEAELTTWGRIEGPYNSDPERPVWVVKMKGRWLLVGGPPLEDPTNSETAYWDECTIIIDARTGESLSLPIE